MPGRYAMDRDSVLDRAVAAADLVRHIRFPTATSSNLSSTTAFLLLCVFAIVNVACFVLRRRRDRDPNTPVFFTAPRALPLIAAVLRLFWQARGLIAKASCTRSPAG